MNHSLRLLALVPWLLAAPSVAQSVTDGLRQTYELQASVSDGSTPLWLNANRYGLSSLRGANGYLRACLERPLSADSLKAVGLGYGVDVAVPTGYTSHVVLQQAYVALRYKHGELTLGQKQQPMAWLNNQLSSGAQTLGINARPVPGVRLELPDYYRLPYTHGWLSLKGHVAYGWLTDGSWQERWTHGATNYVQGEMLHTKAGYLRIGPDTEQHPFSLELGLEMACQFGGTMYHTSYGTLQSSKGPRAWLDALLAQGSDEADPTYHNVGGNQLGSWVARANYQWPSLRLSLYADHFFEDHSSMFFVDYDGYGTGAQWNERTANRYLMYPLRDMLWGIEAQLTRCPWLRGIVVEYLDTRYQSGPIYHDHNPGVSDHIGGDDNYYNHYLYQGWSHWGQVMGNPLYRSPLYNDDATLTIRDNRFRAFHLGLMGEASAALSYRLLLSWQQGYGTYQSPLLEPARNLSLMAEATYAPQCSGLWRNMSLRAALGMDRGALLGDNLGMQLTLIYHID